MYLSCYRPPFEVMEVWLEGIAMHLSVGVPLPQDLEYDISHYPGKLRAVFPRSSLAGRSNNEYYP